MIKKIKTFTQIQGLSSLVDDAEVASQKKAKGIRDIPINHHGIVKNMI